MLQNLQVKSVEQQFGFLKSMLMLEGEKRHKSAETPTFQDVNEKVLPADPILILRSRIPSRLHKLIC